MFGMEQMVKNMLEESGINLEDIQRQAIEAVGNMREFQNAVIKSQHDISIILHSLNNMQRINSAKLDAIINHLGITMEISEDGNRIETSSAKADGNTAGN